MTWNGSGETGRKSKKKVCKQYSSRKILFMLGIRTDRVPGSFLLCERAGEDKALEKRAFFYYNGHEFLKKNRKRGNLFGRKTDRI